MVKRLGALIDCSRNCVYTVDALKKFIDILADIAFLIHNVGESCCKQHEARDLHFFHLTYETLTCLLHLNIFNIYFIPQLFS